MKTSKLCKLCYISDKQIINIYDENGIELNIAQILKKHFWFKIIENDSVSNVICTDCWWKTENFHKFYDEVKNAHNNYLNISYKTNQLFQLKEKSIIKDIKSDINFIKVENIDDDSNEIVCDTIINEHLTEEFSTVIKNEKEKFCYSNDENNSDNKNDENYSTKNTNIRKPFNSAKKRKSSVENEGNVLKKKTRQNNNVKKATTDEKQCEANAIAIEKKIQIEKEDAQIREYFKMECEMCNYKFVTYLDAKAHYREQHKVEGFIRCCKRKFVRRGAILEHIIQHINPEAYKCHICNKCYSDKEQLSSHVRNHVSPEVKPYKCDICEKTFAKQYQLTHHKKYRHFTEADKKFSCDECGKGFISKCYLKSHIRGVHEFAFAQICDICAKVFTSKPVLENHRQSHFNNEVKPRLQCYICGVWLKHKKSLRTHIARHKDTTHTCPQCGKVSANKNALNKHLKCVHSGKTYICHICSKEFKQPIGLKEHMASHTGEVLYTCPYCPKTFNSGANMHLHRKKIHPIECNENLRQRNIPLPNIL